MTILGVSVGIGAILFLVSFGYGLQKILLERITTKESLLTLDVTSPETRIITLNEKTLKEISEIPKVEKVSPQAILPAQISFKELTSETVVNLVDPEFFSLAGILPQWGKVFDPEDSQPAVVNSTVAELFNLKPEQILNQKLKFIIFLPKEETPEIEIFEIEREFEVVGVLEEVGAPSQVYLKRQDLKEIPIQEYQLAKVKVSEDKFMEEVREELIGRGFLVSALSDTIKQANRIFRAIQIILGIFGIIALIVAAIGLANTMTISLLERTQDIGVMRAIGASSKDIRNLFLVESTVIGFGGGLGGILVGWLASFLFNGGVNILARTLGGTPMDLFYTPSWFVIFIIVFATAVGYFTGIFPAKRASRLNPLEALRYK